MWNESLKIGVDKIDKQHEMLFLKVGELVDSIIDTGEYQKEKIISTILFLKNYAVTHFADEEAYQISINDANYLQHKILHENFVETVLEHERKLVASDFDPSDVSKFTGTLLAWLTYHVSDVDQKIGKMKEVEEITEDHAKIISECFIHVVQNYINMSREKDINNISLVNEHQETFDDAIRIKHKFTHILEGCVVFKFSHKFVDELLYSLTRNRLDKIGVFENTFFMKISNIIIENIYRCLYVDKYELQDVTLVLSEDEIDLNERISLDTGMGIVEIDFTIQ